MPAAKRNRTVVAASGLLVGVCVFVYGLTLNPSIDYKKARQIAVKALESGKLTLPIPLEQIGRKPYRISDASNGWFVDFPWSGQLDPRLEIGDAVRIAMDRDGSNPHFTRKSVDQNLVQTIYVFYPKETYSDSYTDPTSLPFPGEASIIMTRKKQPGFIEQLLGKRETREPVPGTDFYYELR